MSRSNTGRGRARKKPPQSVGFGDDQGTRVGSPTPVDRESDSGGSTGAGAESARGIHAHGGGEEVDRAPEPRAEQADGTPRAGSEPLRGRQREHVSGYGGAGGRPKTSSDQREPLDPEGGAEIE